MPRHIGREWKLYGFEARCALLQLKIRIACARVRALFPWFPFRETRSSDERVNDRGRRNGGRQWSGAELLCRRAKMRNRQGAHPKNLFLTRITIRIFTGWNIVCILTAVLFKIILLYFGMAKIIYFSRHLYVDSSRVSILISSVKSLTNVSSEAM